MPLPRTLGRLSRLGGAVILLLASLMLSILAQYVVAACPEVAEAARQALDAAGAGALPPPSA